MFCYCFGGLYPREPSVSRVSPVLHPELCLQRHQAEGGSTGYGPHLRITANGIHAPRPQLVERTVNPTLPAPRTHPTATPRGCAPRVPSEPVQRQRYLSLSQLTHFSPTPQPPKKARNLKNIFPIFGISCTVHRAQQNTETRRRSSSRRRRKVALSCPQPF